MDGERHISNGCDGKGTATMSDDHEAFHEAKLLTREM